MCGRFTSLTPPETLADMFDCGIIEEIRGEEFRPNFNVAPSTRIFAVASSAAQGRMLGRLRWGLVPHWAKTSGSGQINARSETISEKPTFRDSFRKRRCIIPMTGYYEWRTVGITDQPAGERTGRGPAKRAVYVTRSDGRPMAVAGLWSIWSDRSTTSTREGPSANENHEGAAHLRTCCVVTRDANEMLASVHDRMPVVLEEKDWPIWLGETTDIDESELLALLRSDSDTMSLGFVDVGSLVNNVRNNGPELIVPVA